MKARLRQPPKPPWFRNPSESIPNRSKGTPKSRGPVIIVEAGIYMTQQRINVVLSFKQFTDQSGEGGLRQV